LIWLAKSRLEHNYYAEGKKWLKFD
jgi:hypothetical protein